MQPAIGQTLSHYDILGLLGTGGMGVVYKARDLRLDRPVALKFLPPELIRHPEAKERFIHEARTSSALQHPNICVVYGIEETDDGQAFISMEYLDGETLEQLLRSAPLSLERAVEIAAQVAEGLSAAHQAGIVHRDLKPGNIIITPGGPAQPAGVAKILDFGGARSAARAPITTSGTLIGTAAYMSPEQARGDPSDHRTDLWSLGIILYEMVTGRRPFQGEYDQATLYAIIHETPRPVSTARPDVAPALEEVISRCLQKSPAARFPDAGTLRAALRAVQHPSASAPPSTIRSIAVLPFTDISPDKENTYFSDGLTEEIIARLSRLHNLKIASRATAMSYDRTGKSVHQIAADLGVQYLLEGSVRKHGNALRITTQLVDAAQDAYLWAETYNGTTDEIFTIQENVATRIAKALRLRLTPRERQTLKRRATQNTEAYQLYLKGRYFWGKRTKEGLEAAIRHFEKAIAIDDNFALAWAGISDAYNLLSEYGDYPRSETAARSKAAVLKALELDNRLAEAHASLANLLMVRDLDWKGAEKELKLAIRFDPSYATAHHWYAEWLSLRGRVDEALAEGAKAMELDPLSAAIVKDQGLIYYYARDYDGAIDCARKAIELDPAFGASHRLLSLAYLAKGMVAEAIAENQRWSEKSGKAVEAAATLAYCHAAAGAREEALRIVDLLSESEASNGNVCRMLGLVYAALGDSERAVDWIERAYAIKADAVGTLRVDPKADPLRSHPRFRALLRGVGLPE